MNPLDTKRAITTALAGFATQPLAAAATALFDALGYKSEKRLPLNPNTPDNFLATFAQGRKLNPEQALVADWQSVDFLFQLTDDEVRASAGGTQQFLFDSQGKYNGAAMESYLFFAIALKKPHYTRTELSGITRAVNGLFPMPVMLLFRHGLPAATGERSAAQAGDTLTLAVINRRLHKREESKDAPKQDGKDHISVIRLITRLMFCWFVKEKGLIPDALFDERKLAEVLNGFAPSGGSPRPPACAEASAGRSDGRGIRGESSVFYKAIFQNLFFATLDTEVDQRGWVRDGQHFMAHSPYRHRELFQQPADALDLFQNIPFLNGGLFECLDKDHGENRPGGAATPRYERIDGFSRRPDSQPVVPDFLFFGPETAVDLSADYGDAKFKRVKVRGLIRTFNHYKFTIAENTPIEEEIALDPELSGKVFENLLAAYNPETGATARKQTGSFYTPREIVNYMVDEALIACFKTKLEAAFPKLARAAERSSSPPAKRSGVGGEGRGEVGSASSRSGDLSSPSPPSGERVGVREQPSTINSQLSTEQRLRHLFAYNDEPHQFTPAEVHALIAAIDSLRSLDPAVGSGAFPMGILHKLVFILGKLDPQNEKWRERQRQRALRETAEAFQIGNKEERRHRLEDINEVFEQNASDYGRKLYLIENCIYGVDIQPIAVQIAKMRFFISLVADQKVDDAQPNRGVRPLPNLETKFVAANTLIGITRPGQQLLRNREIEAKEAELRRVRERHFLARSLPAKRRCRDDARLRAEIAGLLKTDGWDTSTARKLAAWDPYDQNASAEFFDPEWMFGVRNEFDVEIGNPPYGAKFKEAEKELFLRVYHHQDYQLDSYLLFLERGFDLLRPSGLLSFIIPNTWLSNLKLRRIRKFVFCSQVVQEIVHYSRKVFDAIVDTEVVILRKTSPGGTTTKVTIVSEADLTVTRQVLQAKWAALNGEPVNIFADPALENLVAKVQRNARLLKELCDVTVGMKPYQVGKGCPKQTREIVEKRVFDANHQKDESYRPLLRGRDIEKYVTKWGGDRWIKYGNHLAEPRPSAGFDLPQKIVIRQTGDTLVATLDTQQFVCMNNMHTIVPKDGSCDLLFILGLLNSRLLNHYFQWLNPEKGEALAEVKKEHVEKLVVKNAKSGEIAGIAKRVEKILMAKQQNPTADTTALEREIDQEVYALYGLTPEEIRIVEEAAP